MIITLKYEKTINTDELEDLTLKLGDDYYFFTSGKWFDNELRNIITDQCLIDELDGKLEKEIINNLKDDICDTPIYDIANDSQITVTKFKN